jgi:hypothetical protein
MQRTFKRSNKTFPGLFKEIRYSPDKSSEYLVEESTMVLHAMRMSLRID